MELSASNNIIHNRGVTGRGGYIVSETGRASGTFLNADSGCLIEDIWLKREMPTEALPDGSQPPPGGFYGTFGISYRTVTGPDAYNTVLYAPLTGFSQYSGHSLLTASNSVCAEAGVDFTALTGELWFRSHDRTPLQLTGIQVLEDYESNVNAAKGTSDVRHGEFVSPGPLDVLQTNTGARHLSARQNTTSKIFWIQLRDLSGSSTADAGPLNDNPGSSVIPSYQTFNNRDDTRVRPMNN